MNNVTIRNLNENDIEKIAQTFTFPWSDFDTTLKRWQQNFGQQQAGIRTCCVLEQQKEFLGYGHLLKLSENFHFSKSNIPEINDVWIDEKWRGRGLGKSLIAHLEQLALHEGYQTIGIGVGLYKDYGPAQQLYFKLGYEPDGNGITYKGTPVTAGEKYPVDDDLILWLIKPLGGQ